MTHPVLQCEERRRVAMNTADTSAFQEFCDPAMTYRHSSGVIDDLTQYIYKLESQQVKYSNVEFKELMVVVPAGGDKTLAIVMGSMFADVTRPTESVQIASHFQSTWTLADSTWKLIAVHGAPIARPS